MRLRTIALAVVIIFLYACAMRESFQPLPPMFKNWAKDGILPDGVKAALLECGYDNPYTGFQSNKRVNIEDLARGSQCMKRNGFRYLLGGGKTICDIEQWQNLAACRN